MGDSQDAKGKGQYHSWSGPENRLLLRSLVDAINNGFRDASGKFNKLTFETRVLSVLRQQLGSKKTYGHYKNRMKILKTRYHNLTDFLRCNSGFGWDPETNKFTADDEVWKVYLKANPNNKYLRDDSFEDFEELQMIFGQNTARGQNAVGLGDDVNPFNSQIEDSERANDISFVEMMNSGEDIIHQQGYENVVFSSLEKSTGEKLPLRKKARTDSYLDKACEEVTEISSQIFGMIQKRWEKEDEEKEAKDKANNVWDAINEIPDLDDDLRYEAMTLVHSLGMKSGFVKMSVADRRGWIKQNLRKQS
ncbi:hypothetical protein HID58_022828 [Brassica napus]|uniref:Myb/SANT-like domain-containing protein n=2 Tax=Brassica TaxID=3705 RepID=A0ABQ8D2Q2_BRANA|nr:uncharacterized protein At2g29880-like [Brassica napus]KAH0922810.1 hypothetical protein HID58_022828 [Brassica napus]CAG7871333.1 unnamed protein product [Brassica rapa]VDC67281.1 unnamed protein product [Brassica rapa]